jgi:hypothetical protein
MVPAKDLAMSPVDAPSRRFGVGMRGAMVRPPGSWPPIPGPALLAWAGRRGSASIWSWR